MANPLIISTWLSQFSSLLSSDRALRMTSSDRALRMTSSDRALRMTLYALQE